MKKFIRKIKDWLIRTLGGYTEASVLTLIDACYKTHIQMLEPWAKTVQELCRRYDGRYYDWACEYCAKTCDKRNSWCERFMPEPVNEFPHIDINALK